VHDPANVLSNSRLTRSLSLSYVYFLHFYAHHYLTSIFYVTELRSTNFILNNAGHTHLRSPHPPSSPTSPHRPLTPPILHFSNAFTSITTNRGNGNDTKNHILYSSSNNCDLSSNIFSSEARRSRTWKVCIITHITKNLYRHVTRMHMHIRWSPRRKWNNADDLADNGRGVSRARGRSLSPPSTQDPYSHSPTFCLCSPHPRSPTPTPTPTLPLLLPTPPRHLLPAGAPMILRVGNDTGGAGEYNP
jgi:hypothetical protein